MDGFHYSHVMLGSERLTEAVSWYQEKLGFLARFSVSEHYASLHHPRWKMRLDIHPCEIGTRRITGGPWIYLNVEDIGAAVTELAAVGIDCDPVFDLPNVPRYTTFRDPEGHVWGLEESAGNS